jgi:hypothetical protein
VTRQLDQDTGPVNVSPKRTLFAGSQAAFGADGSLAPLAHVVHNLCSGNRIVGRDDYSGAHGWCDAQEV